ncbi:MAG: LytR family transcriptional regulator [Lachnospiraceae bacterium]|uniref:LytR family transcriptional regulator n=1 Tax=Candidatus Weimeria bifida TaxID=2599074 RepID=A0A6N7J062_9FIRM|nr:LytR family transcriptional regulator [Candidatus Weimeria bifida]RRF96684.1 MAG: LytR family transcriptional regulator [Lachnospiraceae bacterium]
MRENTPRPSGKTKSRKRRKVFLIVELIILVLVLIVLFFWLKFGKIHFQNVGKVKTNTLSAETVKSLSGYTNFMVFGVDSRSTGTDATQEGRSDVQILVSINNDTKKMRLLSVYRDSFLNTDPMGTNSTPYRKANAAYSLGGEKQALEMMNGNLDLNVSKFVTFDFNAVVDVVDDIGGIEVNVSQAEYDVMKASNHEWNMIPETAKLAGKSPTYLTHPGLQKLNGVQACAYCRIRHCADNKGDLGRAERQRRVLRLVLDKVKKASLSQLNDIIDDILPKISTNFSVTEILSLATSAKSYSMDKSLGFPFTKWIGTIKPWGSIVVPCTLEDNVKELHQRMFDETDYTPSEKVRSISQTIISKTGKNKSSAVDYSSAEVNMK